VVVNDLREASVNVVFLLVVPAAERFVIVLWLCHEMRHVECVETLFPPCVIPRLNEVVPATLGGDIAGRYRDGRAVVGSAIVEINLKHGYEPLPLGTL